MFLAIYFSMFRCVCVFFLGGGQLGLLGLLGQLGLLGGGGLLRLLGGGGLLGLLGELGAIWLAEKSVPNFLASIS